MPSTHLLRRVVGILLKLLYFFLLIKILETYPPLSPLFYGDVQGCLYVFLAGIVPTPLSIHDIPAISWTTGAAAGSGGGGVVSTPWWPERPGRGYITLDSEDLEIVVASIRRKWMMAGLVRMWIHFLWKFARRSTSSGQSTPEICS